MPKIYIISNKDNIKHCDLIEVDDKLYEFLNSKNCYIKEEFEKRLLQYVTEVYNGESGQTRMSDPHV